MCVADRLMWVPRRFVPLLSSVVHAHRHSGAVVHQLVRPFVHRARLAGAIGAGRDAVLDALFAGLAAAYEAPEAGPEPARASGGGASPRPEPAPGMRADGSWGGDGGRDRGGLGLGSEPGGVEGRFAEFRHQRSSQQRASQQRHRRGAREGKGGSGGGLGVRLRRQKGAPPPRHHRPCPPK